MSKINTRSPYFISFSDTGITSAILDIYIYTGARVTTMDSVTYSLTSEVYKGYVSFEVSQIISDYVDTLFNGEYESQPVWVNYQVTKSIEDVAQTPEAVVQSLVLEGLGYFEDGANPQLTNRLLQSNTTIYTQDSNFFYVAIQQDDLTRVDLKKDGVVVTSYAFTPTGDSADIIRYVGYTNITECGGTNYLFEDRNDYLFQDGNVFIFNDISDVIDEILITYSDAAQQSVKVKTITERKYTPYRLTFVNKFGALQSVWMFKRSDVTMNIESEGYRAFLYTGDNYNTSDHQYRNFNVTAREEIELNSGFYPEDYNEVFRQMSLSEKIWIDYEGNLLPVNIKSKSLSFKTQVNDKLIDYKIGFEFAFDKINSVF